MAIAHPEIPVGSIFEFHRVLPENAPAHAPGWAISLPAFEAFVDRVQAGRRIVPLQELVRPKGRPGHQNASADCALAFLGGWADSFDHVWPLLRKRRIPATVFLPVRLIGTDHRLWPERLGYCLDVVQRKAALSPSAEVLHIAWQQCSRLFPWMMEKAPQELQYPTLYRLFMRRSTAEAEEFVSHLEMELFRLSALEVQEGAPFTRKPSLLSWEQVKAMASDGIAFGSQTLHHSLLTRMPPSHARSEIADSRRELEERLGQAIPGFAYPWGSHAPWIRQEVESAGYQWAVAGSADSALDPATRFTLPATLVTNDTLSGRKARAAFSDRLRSTLRGSWSRPPQPERPLPDALDEEPRGAGRERIRIAFIIDVLENWKGGTEQQLRKIIHALDLEFFDPLLYVFSPSAVRIGDDVPCPVIFLGTGVPGQWSRTSVIAALTRELRRVQPHIVQTFFRDGNYYGTLAARLARVPIVINTWRNLGYWITPLDRIFLSINERFVDEWQCNSRAIEAYLVHQRGVPAHRIEILPNALDLSHFHRADEAQKRAARERLQLPPGAPIFVAISNLRPVKDLITLVHAAELLRREMPDARILILGDGPLREPLQSTIHDLRLGDRVQLVPAQSDVRPYLWAADAGILTSRNEGLSNVVLEYMAAGLPTLLSDIEANRELAAGHFFRTGDPQDLCRQLVHLCQTPALMQDIVTRNQAIVDQFSLSRFTSRLQSHYTGLIAGLPELPDE